jgi:prevent-host-death family protein
MEKSIAAAEANRRFSRLLRKVQAGDSFVVTSRGRLVARILPVRDQTAARRAARSEQMRRLKTRTAQNIPPWTRDELYDDAPDSDGLPST